MNLSACSIYASHSYHTIYKCTPEQHQKLVHNIHKTTQRLKRQKMAARRDRNSVSMLHEKYSASPGEFYS